MVNYNDKEWINKFVKITKKWLVGGVEKPHLEYVAAKLGYKKLRGQLCIHQSSRRD